MTQGSVALAKADYGAAWNFWPFMGNNTNAGTMIAAQVSDNLVLVGTRQGKGTVWRATLAGAGTPAPDLYTATTSGTMTVNASNIGVVSISAPTGGVGQFKGLTQTTLVHDLYVQVICLGVQPMYYTTWATQIDDGTSNGWVLSCYTGIPQCAVSLVDGYNILDSTAGTTVSTGCMNDPRYLTWRVMTLKIDKNATISWYRVDSYWNASASSFSSSWGVGVRLSTHILSGTDNIGTATATLGKTFVFAYGDGSGIQLNHIAFGTTPHATNNAAGTGTNTLTSAPTIFTNTSPN